MHKLGNGKYGGSLHDFVKVSNRIDCEWNGRNCNKILDQFHSTNCNVSRPDRLVMVNAMTKEDMAETQNKSAGGKAGNLHRTVK